MGRPRNVANGAVPPCAAIEAARAPPGLESVSFVCGTCHAREAELFRRSAKHDGFMQHNTVFLATGSSCVFTSPRWRSTSSLSWRSAASKAWLTTVTGSRCMSLLPCSLRTAWTSSD